MPVSSSRRVGAENYEQGFHWTAGQYIWPADRTLEDFGGDDIANFKFSNQEFDAIRSWVESSGAVSPIKADITVLSKCCSWRVTDLCRPCIIINAPLETINTTPGPASLGTTRTINTLSFLFFSFLFFFFLDD